MINSRRIIDAIVIVFAVWLVISGVIFFSGMELLPMWSQIIVGLGVIAFALWGEALPKFGVPELFNAVLGTYLLLSPWLLSFTGNTMATWNCWVFGALIVLLEVLAMPGGYMRRTPHQPA